jgi:hypothetical protein
MKNYDRKQTTKIINALRPKLPIERSKWWLNGMGLTMQS